MAKKSEKSGCCKKVGDFQDRDLTAISSRELVAVPRYRRPRFIRVLGIHQ